MRSQAVKMVRWHEIKLTDKQLAHIKFITSYHLKTSENEKAKAISRKLMWCLENWIKDTPEEKYGNNHEL